MAKYLDSNGLTHLIGKIKTTFLTDVNWDSTNKKITKTKNGSTTDVWTPAAVASSGSYSDLSNKPTIPSAGTGSSYPAMDGTRSLGSNDGYARVDHVHPTDTSRAAAQHVHDAGDITTGTMDMNRLPVGTTAATVAQGNHTHAAYANQNAFSNVKVGSTTIAADTTTDTLTLVEGSNSTLTPDATNDKVTIAATDTTYPVYSGTTTPGLVPGVASADADGLVLCADGAWKRAAMAIYNDIENNDMELQDTQLLCWDQAYGFYGVDQDDVGHDTTYGAGTGLSLSGTTFNHSNSVTAGTAGTSSATSGATLAVPYVTYDAQGHVTTSGTHTHTISGLAASAISSGTLAAARLPDATTSAKGAVIKDTSITDGTTSTHVPTSAAVSTYVNDMLGDVAGALVYKGTAATASAISGASYKKGWYWVASAAFTLYGSGSSAVNVEAGDMIIAKQDKTTTFSDDVDVVQTNIETLTTTEIDAIWTAA